LNEKGRSKRFSVYEVSLDAVLRLIEQEAQIAMTGQGVGNDCMDVSYSKMVAEMQNTVRKRYFVAVCI
jgi:hypothetical protein